MQTFDGFADGTLAKYEIGSASMQSNARSLAKLASIMANGGGPILSESAWKSLHEDPKVGVE